MKRVLDNPITRALVVVAIVTLIVGGMVYARDILWPGKAQITIDVPEGEGDMTVMGVEVTRGTWDESAKTWTVSIPRGSMASLMVHVKNEGGDAATCYYYVSDANPAPGVTINSDVGDSSGWTTTGHVFGAGDSEWLTFQIRTTGDAEPGSLPEIQLKLGT